MRYSGVVGFAVTSEAARDVYRETYTEKKVVGTVKQRTEVLALGSDQIPSISTNTSISVLARSIDTWEDVRYITFQGRKWSIRSIVHGYPRVTIFIGEVWNG